MSDMAEPLAGRGGDLGSVTGEAVLADVASGVARAEARVLKPKPFKPRQLLGALGTHAVLVLTSIVCVFPVLWVVSTSFKPERDTFSTSIQLIPAHPTLDNYIHVFGDDNHLFFTWLQNSLIVAISTMIIGVAISLTGAYAISRFDFLGKRGLLLSFLITQMFPAALLLVPLYRIFLELGLLDQAPALIVAYATSSLPFSVYMLKNFFDAVPKELDQAGLVDGLGNFGVFWRIIAPLTLPGIAVVAFFNFMNGWNEYFFANAFLQSNTSLTLPIGLHTYVFQFGANWGKLTAGSVLVTIPVFILFVYAQRFLITGLTGGSVKG